MNQYYLSEDKKPQQIPVRFSSKISNKINTIYEFNKDNIDDLLKWLDYIEWLKKYMSNRSIAWDYANQHIKFPNNTRFVKKLNIGYTVKCDTNGAYVYVFMLDPKLQEYGLKDPVQESIFKQQNTHPKQLSTDEYCRMLLEKYDIYLHNLFR